MLLALVTIVLRLPLARMAAMRLSDRDVSRTLLDRALSREAADRLERRNAAEISARSAAAVEGRSGGAPRPSARRPGAPAPEHP